MRIDRTDYQGSHKYKCWDEYNCSIVASAVVKRDSDHVYLQDINVGSCYRGQGIGTVLLKRIMQDFNSRIVADVFEDRVPWYERNGFRKLGKVKNLVRVVKFPRGL